ncbi:MAG: xylulokinase [Desulfobacterales bacterium]
MQTESATAASADRAVRYVLAFDLGSSSIKAAIVSDGGVVLACAAEPVVTQIHPHGGAEQDPEAWWESALRTGRRAIAESGVPPQHIVAVACDSQWSLAVPVDDACKPLMNAVHWLDTRGGIYNRRLIGGFPRIKGYNLFKLARFIRLTGLVPTQSGVDSLGHVLFIKNERPEIYRKIYRFLEPMDFLTARLSGRITATQKSMAIFMITDNRQWGSRHYSERLLRETGLDRDKFPELIPNNGVVGPLAPDAAASLGLSGTTQVVSGISDSNASLIGSGAVDDFDAIIYIGTSQYLTFHVPYKKTNLLYMMTSLPSPVPGRYYLLGEQGVGGKCLELFLKQMVYADDRFETGRLPADAYIRYNEAAQKAPAGSGGLIFLPWLNGAIVPDEDFFVRAGFVNISLHTERRHMARAVMEGLAYNNRWTAGAAEKYIKKPVRSFRFSGGGALSDLWAQIHADVLDVPIHQVADPVNTTVRGCALMALAALGKLELGVIPEMVRIQRVYKPDAANRGVYDKLYVQYRRLFQKNRKIFKAINQ